MYIYLRMEAPKRLVRFCDYFLFFKMWPHREASEPPRHISSFLVFLLAAVTVPPPRARARNLFLPHYPSKCNRTPNYG